MQQSDHDLLQNANIQNDELRLLSAKLIVSLEDSRLRHAAFEVAARLADIDPDECWQLIQASWNNVATDGEKLSLMSLATRSRYIHRHRVIHLGMIDQSLKVQNRAMTHVRVAALFDPSLDFNAYMRWFKSARVKPADRIVAEGYQNWIAALREATANGEAQEMKRLVEFARSIRIDSCLRQFPQTQPLVDDANRWQLLVDVIQKSDELMRNNPRVELADSRDTIRAAGRLLRSQTLPDEFVQQKILPLSDSANPRVRYESINILAQSKTSFAFERIKQMLEESIQSSDPGTEISSIAKALAQFGNPSVIPIMIGIIDADNSYDTVYGVGNSGLHPLTGVNYEKSHDGEWWRQWWDRNRGRYSLEAQSIAIPDFPKTGAGKAYERQRALNN